MQPGVFVNRRLVSISYQEPHRLHQFCVLYGLDGYSSAEDGDLM